jgi:hypothetical protein
MRKDRRAGFAIGPLTLSGNQPAVIAWCVAYVIAALFLFS